MPTNMTDESINSTDLSIRFGEDDQSPSDHDDHMFYIFGGAFALAGIIIVSFIIWVYKRKQWGKSQYVQPMKDDEPAEPLLPQNQPVNIPVEYQIDPNCLTIEDRIGNGRFGNVYQGMLKKNRNDPGEGEMVAVKAVRPSCKYDLLTLCSSE